MRTPILAANWKMQKTAGEALAFCEAFLPKVSGAGAVDIAIAPPFTALERVRGALQGSNVALAAQNVHPEENGAFTGEIAPGMLEDLGCSYVIVGHSERRQLFGESDELVARKAEILLARGIRPIVCVGETDVQREAGDTLDVIGGQLTGSLTRVPVDRAAEVVVAYEPIWAIGTGKTATPEIAQEVHAFIRQRLADAFGASAGEMRIQYGGSVKPDNVAVIMSQADIDGALVGGASLDPESFAAIVHYDS